MAKISSLGRAVTEQNYIHEEVKE